MTKKHKKFTDRYALQRKIGQAHLLPNMSLEKLQKIWTDNPDYETSKMVKDKVIRFDGDIATIDKVWQAVKKELSPYFLIEDL